jgi:hypothetical protein
MEEVAKPIPVSKIASHRAGIPELRDYSNCHLRSMAEKLMEVFLIFHHRRDWQLWCTVDEVLQRMAAAPLALDEHMAD